jgi:HlyD family type I secretion membrane fusion protein
LLTEFGAGRNIMLSSDVRGVSFAGVAVIVLAFGVLGTWAAIAPLDSAVISNGILVSQTNRKVVQHFEGGIISQIFVHEGETIERGQILYRLEDTQPRANVDLYRSQLDAAYAKEARLAAEQVSSDKINFPPELAQRMSDAIVERAVADQTRQFEQRKASLREQIEILRTRIKQSMAEIDGLHQQEIGNSDQINLIEDEVSGLELLYQKGLAPKTRLRSLQRERARLEGDRGRAEAEQAKATDHIKEDELQIKQLTEKVQEEVAKDLVDLEDKIVGLREKLTIAKDVLSRLDIVSPESGTAQNLRFFTVGAVIKAGETLLEIVPQRDKLIVHGHVSPLDVDKIGPAMSAEVRFPSFHSRILPIIHGVVESISRDRLVDETTKEPYFLALVSLRDAEIPSDFRAGMTAGLPAQVIISTGERTVLQYLYRPLASSFRITFREQ